MLSILFTQKQYMSGILLLLFLGLMVVSAQDTPALIITGPDREQLIEGSSYDFTWTAVGLKTVSIRASGDLTSLPDRNRGRFDIVVADSVPADVGFASWQVPFLDTLKVRVTFKGFDEAGQLISMQDRVYAFRPSVLRNKTIDGIYVDVRDENQQRMYVLRDNEVIRAYLTSGSHTNEYYPSNVHPKKPHDHPGVYRVVNKYPNWYSRAFQVDMPWAMRYVNGHFIHATSPNYYDYLGSAASSGCNRLHLDDAKELYDMTPIGTRVEIIVK